MPTSNALHPLTDAQSVQLRHDLTLIEERLQDIAILMRICYGDDSQGGNASGDARKLEPTGSLVAESPVLPHCLRTIRGDLVWQSYTLGESVCAAVQYCSTFVSVRRHFGYAQRGRFRFASSSKAKARTLALIDSFQ